MQKDKELVNDLNWESIEFSVPEKTGKIEKKSNICINVFRYENKLTFPVHLSDQKSENSMDLLLIFDGDKSHYVYIKDFDRFTFHKTKPKNKKYFCKFCLQRFCSRNVLNNIKNFVRALMAHNLQN